MTTPHEEHTATLLLNGRVLIAGGGSDVFATPTASTETYDPAAGTFSPAGLMIAPRRRHTATLLAGGRVFMAGGLTTSSSLATAGELYDAGEGYPDTRRPVISFGTNAGTEPGSISLTGTGFRGDSEGSSGTTTSSAANLPLLQLLRIDSEQMLFPVPAGLSSATSFLSETLSGLPNGHYRATIVSNGVRSLQYLLVIAYPPPVITQVSPNSGPTNGSQYVVITGTNLDNVISVMFGGVPANLLAGSTATSLNVASPSNSAGATTLTVTTAGGSASAPYTYVFDAPEFPTATASSPTSVTITWQPVYTASAYEVWRSSNASTYSLVGTTNGTLIIDYGLTANTAYLYKVRAFNTIGSTYSPYSSPDLATTVIFTDPMLSGIRVKAVHINELRTATNAVRALIGSGPASFSDSVTPGVTVIRAVHFNQIRSNVDAVRATLGLLATPGAQVVAGGLIQQQDILFLRLGVQ